MFVFAFQPAIYVKV